MTLEEKKRSLVVNGLSVCLSAILVGHDVSEVNVVICWLRGAFKDYMTTQWPKSNLV